MVTFLLLAACAPAPTPAPETGPSELPTLALASRISLDLRGRRPTEAELLTVEADPDALDGLVADWVADPGFGERLLALYADVYRTRSDYFVVGADGDAALLDPAMKVAFLRSVGEEPLRIIQRIADDDLPWTTLVTADWTMANDLMLDAWPLEPLEEGSGWRRAAYTDERPTAGVLSTNGMWWRYTTTIENVNRGRAEAIARYILCDDRFDQTVDFRTSTDVLDRAELQERTQTDPSCIGCHVVVDPMGSFLFGFYRNHPESYSEAAWYYPGREEKWYEMTGIAPAYYGQPGESLYDLGQMIASDPAFGDCAVKQGFTFLLGRAPALDDTEAVTRYREAFLTSGLSVRTLYAALVQDPRYRSIDEEKGGVALKRMGPDMLASAIEAVTGFRWEYNDLDMMNTDAWGLRVLAGGADGLIVSQPATDHATTILLSQERLSELAATHAVTAESAQAAEDRTLLREVDITAEPSEGDLDEQIRLLIFRLHGRRAPTDDPDRVALAALWRDVHAEGGDPARAWTVILSALLRHPDFVQY